MIQDIIFEDCDTLKETATKTALIYAGSSELKKEMQKLGINYSKVERGAFTYYVLRHKDFGKTTVKL
jgi:hypothetical protein